jgi:hypothetical protein
MKRHLWALPLILLLAGCGPTNSQDPANFIRPLPIPETSASPSRGEWQAMGRGVERLGYVSDEKPTVRMIIYRFEKRLFRTDIVHADVPKTIRAWRETLPDAIAIVNGTYFHEDLLPSGLLVDEGVRIGTRSFDKDRSGILLLGEHFEIADLSTTDIDLDRYQNYAQSYPFLIRHRLPVVESDSGQAARRTFIGTDENHLYLGIVPDTMVSLYRLADELTQMDIDWQDVLNLDGGSSSAMSVLVEGFPETVDGLVPVPNILTIERIRAE